MKPIGPYSHIAKAGPHLWISAIAGVDPETGELAGPSVETQARQILKAFRRLLEGAGSGLGNVVHVQVYLRDIADFEEMNRAYAEEMGGHRPARTVVAVSGLPKPGALLTMSLQAVVRGEME